MPTRHAITSFLVCFSFFFNLFIFNWRIIALQYCVGFCHTSMNQPSVYICAPFLSPASHLPAHPTPLGCHRAPNLSSVSHTANFHWLSNFIYSNVYVSVPLSQSVPSSPSPHCVHKSVCYGTVFLLHLGRVYSLYDEPW